MSRKKISKEALLAGTAGFASSVVAEAVFLCPRRKIEITENISIPVQGILPFSQKYIAMLAKVALNSGLPMSAKLLDSALTKVHLKDVIREAILKFFYDFLNKYSVNTFISKYLGHFSFFDKSKYENVLRDLIQRLINEKADRDEIIKMVTAEMVHILRLLTEGTLAAKFLNDRFIEAASGAIAAAVDKFIANDAATQISDFLFKTVGQLEHMTFSNFLVEVLNIKREDMAKYIDSMYDLVLGDKMIESIEAMQLGNVAYELIDGIDYDDLYATIEDKLKPTLLKINLTAAANTVRFVNKANNVAEKRERAKKRKFFKKNK